MMGSGLGHKMERWALHDGNHGVRYAVFVDSFLV